jgi:hypothetical protein
VQLPAGRRGRDSDPTHPVRQRGEAGYEGPRPTTLRSDVRSPGGGHHQGTGGQDGAHHARDGDEVQIAAQERDALIAERLSELAGAPGSDPQRQGETLLLEVGGTELSRQAANRCGLAELQAYVHIPMVMSQ